MLTLVVGSYLLPGPVNARGKRPQKAPNTNKGAKDCRLTENTESELENKLRSSHPQVDSTCVAQYQNVINDCLPTKEKNAACDEIEAKLITHPSAVEAFNRQIKEAIRAANCARVSEHCLKKVDLEAYYKSCMRRGLDLGQAEKDGKARERKLADNILYAKLFNAKVEEIKSCLGTQGQQYEKLAKETFTASQSVRDADNLKLASLYCLDHDEGYRICAFHNDGKASTKRLNESDPQALKGLEASPVRMMNEEGLHCSGVVLGNGVDASTNAHCTKLFADPDNVPLQVIDKHGNKQTIMASCGAGVERLIREIPDYWVQDHAVCSLRQPIETHPTYQLVRNNSITTCMKQGWTYMCPDSEIEKFTGKKVLVYHYPFRDGLTASEGYIRYEKETGQFFHRMPLSGGSSGSPLIIDRTIEHEGDRLVLGNTARVAKEIFDGLAPVLDYSDLDRVKIPYLPQSTLEQGAPLFRELSYVLDPRE